MFTGFRVLLAALLFFDVLSSGASRQSCALQNSDRRELTATSPFSDQGSVSLQAGEALSLQISRDQTETFTVELTAGQYAEIVFEWLGTNLTVAMFNPAGMKILPADLPVSQPGPIIVSLLAKNSGTYKLEVGTPVRQKTTGTYQIKLVAPAFPTSGDHNRVAAQLLIAEALSANLNGSKIEKYKQAIQILQNANDPTEAQARLILGDAYRASRDLSNARTNYERAVEIWHALNYRRGEAYARLSLGAATQALGSSKDALEYFRQAYSVFAQIGDWRGEGSALYGQAFAQMSAGQTPQAIELLQSAIQVRQSHGDRIGQANALNMMADGYRMLGDLEKSLDLYRQALEALEGLEHRSLEANILNGKVLVYDDWGDWEVASEGYTRALSVYETMLGQQGLSACISDPPASLVTLCRSAAATIDNLGEIYNSLGNSERALREFNRSLLIRNALKQPQGQGSTRFHIGYSHFLQGNYDQAVTSYKEALPFQEKAGDERGIALTQVYMGMTHSAQNEPEKALELYKKALSKLEASGDMRARAIALDKFATANSLIGKSTESAEAYNRALELWRLIRDSDGEALTLYNMANAQRSEANLKAASEHADRSIKLVESLRQKVGSARFRASYLARNEDYYLLDVDVKMQLFKSSAQVSYLASALNSSEKSRARVLLDALNEAGVDRATMGSDRLLTGLLEQQATLLRKLGSKSQARTRRLSGEHSAAQIEVIDKDINEITDRMDALESQIRSRSPRFASLTRPQPSALPEIQQQLDADTLLLEFALGEKRSYAWVVSPDSIHGFELAPRDQIEAVARRVLEALTARNREVKDESLSQKRARFDKAEAEYVEASAALSKMVLEPVASLLGKKRLVVVADGALQLIPFASLPAPVGEADAPNTKPDARTTNVKTVARNRALLIDNHEIVSLPSASVLALQRRELATRKPAPYDLAVIADPVFDNQDQRVVRAKDNGSKPRKDLAKTSPETNVSPKHNALSSPATLDSTKEDSPLASALRDVGLDPSRPLPRLTHSRHEARGIARAVSSNQSLSALDFKASRETATNPELSKYQIVHFATHGILDLQHPELSGIALSMVDEKGQSRDGYLRLHEIYNLNLPAELVVLSACQTGVGKQIRGEGLIALTRGFMYAGAKSIVGSLWKVDDAATAALMTEFYSQMFTNKLRPAAALRAAQLKTSQEKRWQSPYYWAGFFLQGDWN